MNNADIIKKAAILFADWKEGDEFEFKRIPNDPDSLWSACGADEVVGLLDGTEVRIKPKPVRRLRPVIELIIEGAKRNELTEQNLSGNHVVYIKSWGTGFIKGYEGKTPEEIQIGFPDWFYTTDPNAPATDRIAEMAAAVIKAFKGTPSTGEGMLNTIDRLIREECEKRNIK